MAVLKSEFTAFTTAATTGQLGIRDTAVEEGYSVLRTAFPVKVYSSPSLIFPLDSQSNWLSLVLLTVIVPLNA